MKLMTALTAFALAIGNAAHAQYSQYGVVENFYQANHDLGTNQYAGRAVNPSYWLVDWSLWDELNDRLINNGFVRLGISRWEDNYHLGGGIPQRELAIAYAQAIGADILIYTTHNASDKADWTKPLRGMQRDALSIAAAKSAAI